MKIRKIIIYFWNTAKHGFPHRMPIPLTHFTSPVKENNAMIGNSYTMQL